MRLPKPGDIAPNWRLCSFAGPIIPPTGSLTFRIRYALQQSMSNVIAAIESEIARIEQARNLLAEVGTKKRGTKATAKPLKAKSKMSPAARKRIAAAQPKRWAAVRKAKK